TVSANLVMDATGDVGLGVFAGQGGTARSPDSFGRCGLRDPLIVSDGWSATGAAVMAVRGRCSRAPRCLGHPTPKGSIMTQESVSTLSRRGLLGGGLAAAGATAAVLLAP